MILKAPIEIDFLDFFKTGRFDFIKLGQTKEWILNNFADPDNFDNDFLNHKCNILDLWRY